MKKIYFFIFMSLGLIFQDVKAQAPACTYDYTWLALGKDGIWPDSATNMVSGTVGQPYVQNVTVKVPYDTTDATLGTVTFNRIELQTNITNPANYNLPPGLSLSCTPSNCKFPGNDTSCLVIYGTPTTVGSYTLSFTLKTYVNEVPFFAVNTSVVDYYVININPNTAGISDLTGSKFEVGQSIPNPAHNSSKIQYVTPGSGKTTLKIFNTLGALVLEKNADSNKGLNQFDVDCSTMPEGIYIYTVEFDNKTITKKMMVTH